MRKAGVLSILFVVVLLAVAIMAEAQQQAKVPKIGWIHPGSTASTPSSRLRRELREIGYVESKNIAFEHRYGDNQSQTGSPLWPMSLSVSKWTCLS